MTLYFLFVQVEEDIGGTPVVASKQKDTVKEEAAASSPSKPIPSGSSKGTPSSTKASKGKRKLNGDDVKPSNVPPKKVKTETVCHVLPSSHGLSSEKCTFYL